MENWRQLLIDKLEDLADRLTNFRKLVGNKLNFLFDNKVDKEEGKGLSSNDYTDSEKNKLSGIEAGAQVNVKTDWNAASGDAELLNKPNLGTAAERDASEFASAAQGAKADSAVQPDDLADVAFSGSYDDLIGTPPEPNYPVTSVNNKTGDVVITKGDVGLGQVDNTADKDKPISDATQSALDDKLNKNTTITGGSGIDVGGSLASGNASISLNDTYLNNRYLRKDSNDNNNGYTLELGKLITPEAIIEELFLPSLDTGTSSDKILVVDSEGKVLSKEVDSSVNIGVDNASGSEQFSLGATDSIRFEGDGDTSVSFNPSTKTVKISSVPGQGTGGAVTSFNGRTGGVVSETGDYSTSQVTEGSNLYFTEARVRGTKLTGLSLTSSSNITASDTVIQAFGKLQAQTTGKASEGRKLTVSGASGRVTVSGGEQDLSQDREWTVDLATVSGASGTHTKVVVDSYGRVTGGQALVVGDIPNLSASKITSGTLNIARIPTGTTSTTVALGNDSRFHTHSNKSVLDGTTASFTTALKNKLDGLSNYTLPIASNTVLGGVKIDGNSITINSDGVISTSFSDTKYTAGTGLSLSGTVFSLNTTYTDNRYIKGEDFTWGNLQNKPSTFTPSAHTHNANDINAGTLNIARIPTGTSASTVALGNHTHTFASLTSKPTTLSGYGITDAVPISRQIIAGDGLTGGGSLTANRTISLSSSTKSDIAKGVTAHGWGDHTRRYVAMDSDFAVNISSQGIDVDEFRKTSALYLGGVSTNRPFGVNGGLWSIYNSIGNGVELFVATALQKIGFRNMDSDGWVEIYHSGNLRSNSDNDDRYLRQSDYVDTKYTAGTGLTLSSSNEFSVDEEEIKDVVKSQTEQIAQEAVDGLEIGTVNFLPDSSFKVNINEAIRWRSNLYNTVALEEGKAKYTVIQESSAGRLERSIPLEKGVYSVTIRAKIKTSFSFRNFEGATVISSNSVADEDNFTLHTATFEVPQDGSVRIRAYYSSGLSVDDTFLVDWFTLVEGNKPAISWAPAPEDQVTDWNQTNSTAFDYLKNKPTKLSDFTNDLGNYGNFTLRSDFEDEYASELNAIIIPNYSAELNDQLNF